VLTKYLVTHPRATEFYRLSAGEIEESGSSGLAAIELLSGTAKTRAAGTLVRAGACSDWSASSSHCGTYTASCISRYRAGLDLERIEPRRWEFYTHMFSAAERDWADDTRSRTGALIEEVFTLLWSVKEAYLKASGNCDLSVWAFPRWTVWFDGQVDAMLQPKIPEEFVKVSGGICTTGFSQSFETAAMRVEDMILATVQFGIDQRGLAN